MELIETISIVRGMKKPRTTEKKIEMADLLVSGFNQAREHSDGWKWMEGMFLYHIHKYNLYPYINGKQVSQKAYFRELGIPESTARQRRDVWGFYVERHSIPLPQCFESDWFKVSRALVVLKETNRDRVLEVIELAKRGMTTRDDFLKEVGLLQDK